MGNIVNRSSLPQGPNKFEIYNAFQNAIREVKWPEKILKKLEAVEFNKEPYRKLAVYGAKDQAASEKVGVNLNKGIYLMGPVGCGKTAAMKFLCGIMRPRFKVKTMPDIVEEFNLLGDTGMKRYGDPFIGANYPSNFFIDNLGTETTGSFYGARKDVAPGLIDKRYELFTNYGIITHFSTNLGPAEIQTKYQYKTMSRLREMCNIISFSDDAPDLRF